MSASDSNLVLTKPEAVGRRRAGTADKARRPRDMAASEPADSDAEWEQLELVQRNLSRDALLENCSNPASMEVQQDDEQIEKKQKSQGKLIKEATFKKKSSTSKKSTECALSDTKNVSKKHVPSKKRLLKSDSPGKNLKQNLDLPGQIKNSTKKKPDTAKEHRKSFSPTVSETKKDKIPDRKKCEKIPNKKSPGKGDKNPAGKRYEK
ncbi:hypothetical protein A6R68_05579, partial [Neotoma lepida]